MTKKEIAKLMGYSERNVHYYFSLAADETEIGQKIKFKSNKSTMVKVIDFKLDETLYALSFAAGFTPMEAQFLKENFIHRDEMYMDRRKNKKIELPYNAKQFLFLHKNCRGIGRKVCATCAYIQVRKTNNAGSKLHHYCNLFNTFLNRANPKRDVYLDRCEAYEFSDKPPLILDKNGNLYREEI